MQRDDGRERAAGLDARHGQRLQAPRQPKTKRVVSLRGCTQKRVHAQAASVAGLRNGQRRRNVRRCIDNLLLSASVGISNAMSERSPKVNCVNGYMSRLLSP